MIRAIIHYLRRLEFGLDGFFVGGLWMPRFLDFAKYENLTLGCFGREVLRRKEIRKGKEDDESYEDAIVPNRLAKSRRHVL